MTEVQTTLEILNSLDYIRRDHPDATNWHVWKGWADDSTPVYCRIVETPTRLYLETQQWGGGWTEARDVEWLIIEAFKILEGRDLFTAELIGRLGLDREAIDREGLLVGNKILKALDKKLVYIAHLERELELVRKEDKLLEAHDKLLEALRTDDGVEMEDSREQRDNFAKQAKKLDAILDKIAIPALIYAQGQYGEPFFGEQLRRIEKLRQPPLGGPRLYNNP